MRFILGSQSPRRKQILNFFNLPFIQVPSRFDETQVIFQKDPIAYVQTLALKKTEALAPQFPNDLILTADTVVFFDQRLFNKPQNPSHAFTMLKELSGKWHSVFTAICLYKGAKSHLGVDETKILFNELTDEQISLYHLHDPCLDKAGAYAIQKSGGLVVRKIEGCYYNVMGLPINLLKDLFQQVGIDLWRHLHP